MSERLSEEHLTAIENSLRSMKGWPVTVDTPQLASLLSEVRKARMLEPLGRRALALLQHVSIEGLWEGASVNEALAREGELAALVCGLSAVLEEK